MLIEANKDIVGAAIKTLPSGDFACGKTNGNNIERARAFKPEDEAVEVDFIGFGMILMKKGVFETVHFPHFSEEKLGTNQNSMGEDFSFCIKAKRAGFKLWVHTKCRVGHIKEVMI
jgi:GT2 family glycosyltransferase